jgi:peptidoglycan/xylan/chitin deacetylase (PgdA/CDA1 family)
MLRYLAAGAIIASATCASAAEDLAALQTRCWSPQSLAGTPRERASVRRRVPLDLATLRKVKLAPTPKDAVHLHGAIRRVALPAGKKLVALTFDLCETVGSISGYDGAVVDYLRRNKVKATFFAGGKWLTTHGERGHQLMTDPLFEIGNHGWAHRDTRRLEGERLGNEIGLARAAYERARGTLAARACAAASSDALAKVPPRQRLFRFPFGTCNARALDAVAEAGLVAIQWDVVTGDPTRGRSARAIAATVLKSTKPGSIIIAHANGRGWNTAAALPLFVPQLRARGYTFVTVSELLAAGTPEIAETCYTWRPGDQKAKPPKHIGEKRPAGKGKHVGPLTFETSD